MTEASRSPEILLPTSTYTSSLDETCPSQVDILSQYQSQQSPVVQSYAIHNITKSSAATPGKVALIFNKQPLHITKSSLLRLSKDDLKAITSYCKVRMPTTATKEDLVNKVLGLMACHKNLAKYKSRITAPPTTTTTPSMSYATEHVLLSHNASASSSSLSRPAATSTARCIFAPMDSVNWTSLSAGKHEYVVSNIVY